MKDHPTVDHEAWTEARKALLVKEKEFTKLRDELSAARRALPWVAVEKDYTFEGPNGTVSLSDLFQGKSQLVIYHFMFGPDWKEGCPSCSFWADNYQSALIHLPHRDVSLVTVSHAPLETLEAYKKRMGWDFLWVSSETSDFNYDYHVSFKPEELESENVYYNFQRGKFPSSEGPGLSVFFKNDDGQIYHTYSCYARGLDMINGTYQILDLVPKGRDEAELPWTMAWLKRHDMYGAED